MCPVTGRSVAVTSALTGARKSSRYRFRDFAVCATVTAGSYNIVISLLLADYALDEEIARMTSQTQRGVRDELLHAAVALLNEHGPDALQTRKVAAAAGTSTMAVYTHFGGMR